MRFINDPFTLPKLTPRFQSNPPLMFGNQMPGAYPAQPFQGPPLTTPAPALPRDPRMRDPRANDPRTADPRMNDPRLNDPRANDPRTNDPRLKDPRLRGKVPEGLLFLFSRMCGFSHFCLFVSRTFPFRAASTRGSGTLPLQSTSSGTLPPPSSLSRSSPPSFSGSGGLCPRVSCHCQGEAQGVCAARPR